MNYFQNSIKMKKNIKSVCIFSHIKSISEPGVTAFQLNTTKHEFQPLKHDAWSSSFASSSGIMQAWGEYCTKVLEYKYKYLKK